MASKTKWILALGIGVVGGWALRSISDSPQDGGVKLLETVLKTKERVGRWAATGSERLEDFLAEARAREVEPDITPAKVARKAARRRARTES
jgi:hypothetical protein